MAYSNFTLERVQTDLNIKIIGNQRIFPKDIARAAVNDFLKESLERFQPLAIDSKKAKSEFIIAPTLAELHAHFKDEISLLSGINLNVDSKRGREGFCDFIVSAGVQQFFLTAPIFIVVEAKRDNILAGLGQCMATMYAADLFNKQAGQERTVLYGTVTAGQLWRFIKLENQTAYIETQDYFIRDIELLLGILISIIKSS